MQPNPSTLEKLEANESWQLFRGRRLAGTQQKLVKLFAKNVTINLQFIAHIVIAITTSNEHATIGGLQIVVNTTSHPPGAEEMVTTVAADVEATEVAGAALPAAAIVAITAEVDAAATEQEVVTNQTCNVTGASNSDITQINAHLRATLTKLWV